MQCKDGESLIMMILFLISVSRRVSMEDAHLIHYFENIDDQGSLSAALFGVYDGHGGSHVAEYVSRHIIEELLKNPDFRKG